MLSSLSYPSVSAQLHQARQWRSLARAHSIMGGNADGTLPTDSFQSRTFVGGNSIDGFDDFVQSGLQQLPEGGSLDSSELGHHEGYSYLAQLGLARQQLLSPPVSPSLSSSDFSRELGSVSPGVATEPQQVPTVRTQQPARQTAATRQTAALGPRLTDSKDWHIPSLDETFKLAKKYPGKQIWLDTKTPDDPAVGRRVARQIMELLKKHPEMKSRVVIMNPNNNVLNAIKDEFKKDPEFRYFKNFALDNENLNKISASAKERSPLTGSGDNRYVSIGNPKSPVTPNNFQDLLEEVRKAKKETTNPKSSHYGKKIVAWTLNDSKQIKELVKAGADGILTDNPEMMKKTLDKMGFAADDPKRPAIIAHRGGANSKNTPENTLPRIEDGLRSSADAIEIDVVSAKDGAIVYHDNNPNDLTSIARNIGLEADNKWRPVYPDVGTKARGKRLDQLTISEIRKNYGFERNATSSALANLGVSVLDSAASAPGTALSWLGRKLGIKPLSMLGGALNSVVDSVGKPIFRGVMQGVDKAVTGVWQGLTTAGKGIYDGFGSIFKGNIGKGLGQIGTGLWKGGVKLVSNVAKGAWSVVKGVGNAIGNVGKSIAKGAKSAWKGVKKFFKGLFG
jgi:glycerophosphoryl diester phosphodiesterase